MTDYGLQNYMPINQVFYRGAEVILIENMTKKFITFYKGYRHYDPQTDTSNITIHEYEHYTKKVFLAGQGWLYCKMGRFGSILKLNEGEWFRPNENDIIE